MNLNAHILRLGKIRDKLERGEELNEREIAYVKALWERIAPVATALAEQIAEAIGSSVSGLAMRLEFEGPARAGGLYSDGATHIEMRRNAARERRA